MADPYEVFGIASNADADTVRKRYLQLVREFPPEKCPQRFAEIREAYDKLRDPVTRLHQRIFEIFTDDTIDDIVADVRADIQAKRIPTETLLALAEG